MQTLSEVYARCLQDQPYGHALYHPVSSHILKPGACGYFDIDGNWHNIVQITDSAALKAMELSPIELHEISVAEEQWGPKYSSGVRFLRSVSKAPDGSNEGFDRTFISSAKEGAILVTQGNIRCSQIIGTAEIQQWMSKNAEAIIRLSGTARSIKKKGIWIVTKTYMAKRSAMAVLASEGSGISVRFGAKTFLTSEEWRNGITDSRWKLHESNEGVVLFMSGICWKPKLLGASMSGIWWKSRFLKASARNAASSTSTGAETMGVIPINIRTESENGDASYLDSVELVPSTVGTDDTDMWDNTDDGFDSGDGLGSDITMEDSNDTVKITCVEKIRRVLEDAVANAQEGNTPKDTLKTRIYVIWELEDFLRAEFSPEDKLSSILTITGSEINAQAATCRQYIECNWPLGIHLLNVIDEAIDDGETSQSTDSSVTIAVTLHGEFPRNHAMYKESGSAIQVDVTGPIMAVHDSILALAWLVAVLRSTRFEGLSLSEVTLHQLGSEGHMPIEFEIRQTELRPVASQYSLCWHKLFGHTVIAAGFPIPERYDAIGLEIDVPLMASLSGIVCEAAHEEGLILRGLSTALIPTKKVESDTAIQWHLFSDDDHLLRSQQADRFPELVQVDDILLLCKKKAFLGWCEPAVVILGTKRGAYDNIDKSTWKKLPKWKRFSGFNIGGAFSILGFGGPNASAQVAVGKRQRGHFWDVEHDLRTRLINAQIKPILIYDQQDRRAWLVPTASALLHMAHTLAQHRLELGDPLTNVLPFAEEGSDGGKLAWAAMKNHLNDEIGIQMDSEKRTFQDILLKFVIGIDEATKRTEEVMKRDSYSTSRVCSFEFLDIVTGEPPFRFNMHPIGNSAGLWPYIANSTQLVLCCRGLGSVILPSPLSNKLCAKCQEVPPKKDYLAATIRCMNALQGRYGGRPDVTQITDKLYWMRKTGTLFRDCPESCQQKYLQTLDQKSKPDLLMDDLRECDGAVIFGKITKLTKPAPTVPGEPASTPAENGPAALMPNEI